MPVALSDLPAAALGGAAAHLHAADVVAARQACRALRDALPRCVVRRYDDVHEYGPSTGHYAYTAMRRVTVSLRRPFPLSTLLRDSLLRFSAPLRYIELSCAWRDQGWGNRKGHFLVQLVRDDRVVAEAGRDASLGLAPHALERWSATLGPESPVVAMSRTGDVVKVLKCVGGGGGHQLVVESFRVLFVLQDASGAPPPGLGASAYTVSR